MPSVVLALLLAASSPDTTAPTITSANTDSVSGGATLAHSLTANETVTWSIVGGVDQAQFEISGSTLRWASNGTQSYGSPADNDTNNTYIVNVRATDLSSNTSDQTVTVTVTNTDPHFSSVKLLLGFEGTDASTTITDESGAAHGTATVIGNAQIDTAQFKFGSSSLLLDGSGDGITFPDSNDWQLSTANSDQFTVECFVRPNTTTPTNMHLVQQTSGTGSLGWGLRLDGSSQLTFVGATTGGSFDWSPNPTSSGLTWATGTWYHIAADKDSSGKVRIYRDGTMVASATPSNSAIGNVGALLRVGINSGNGNSFNGWIDEVRITKGVARYASDGGFTAPTAAFLRS